MAEEGELPGLAEACRALADGRAVVVPNPSPMTYGVVATSPQAVNLLKGRPADQHTAVSVHDAAEWQRIVACLDVPPGVLRRIVVLLRQRLSLLVPLRDSGPRPDWIAPAVRDGYLAMFDGWWAPTARLWDAFPRLYGSSANRTGRPPAASAAEVDPAMLAAAQVVDGDALREGEQVHAASSMVRVARDGELSLYRRGAQDAASGLDPDAYVRHLAALDLD
ncbi:MAG TPA: Sua5/YciO/YrdC/YwlC family protein [Streptosporangiales bacterium]